MIHHMKYIFIAIFFFFGMHSYGQQTIYDTIVHDNLQRSFILYVPDSYVQGTATPLVINFHGYTSNAFEQMFYGDFRPVADTAGFLLVHPMGTLDGSGNPYWNSNWGGEVDDIGFTEALIDSLASEYSVNLDRVFSTGMSNGGFMSYTLACELSHRIAAIASVTGTMNLNQSNTCNPVHPTPIMEIHGTADFVVPYNGNFFMESIENTLNYWVGFNTCNAIPIVTPMPDINQNDGCTAEYYRYPDGANGVEVEHYKIINGGHTWPGSPFPSGSGNTNQDINASAKIWGFFTQYDINGRIETTGFRSYTQNDLAMSIYPNPAKDFVSVNWTEISVAKISIVNNLAEYFEVLNVSGQKSCIINLDGMVSGLYFLQFFDDENRLIDQRKLMCY